MIRKSVKNLLLVCLSFLIVIFVVILFRSKANILQADVVDSKLAGWAYGSNIGWVSFNCDHTKDGTLPPNNINTCGTSDYSVSIDPVTIENLFCIPTSFFRTFCFSFFSIFN
ncbi:MAG: hypothetical protein ABIJ83_01090 [Patescibacteria group bacterium]|nr:hypothetical protein [Patescibacteria group bacterium]MBU0880110.1 hypothetical protein [Patescibacteria group bacterium]MBU0897593.1 hypothetical protein [Patescibacteria group bacterium]MBU1783335.1 hypothetical protein [Patescibacteria group bacterium]MBU2081548.1 hypothetical protein [Patescibacteria group bacterium]